MEGQCYAGSIHSRRLLTCRARKQLKRLGDFLFLAIAYFLLLFSHSLFFYLVFHLFTFFRQVRTCVLRIPIPALARKPFSLPFQRLPRRPIVAMSNYIE